MEKLSCRYFVNLVIANLPDPTFFNHAFEHGISLNDLRIIDMVKLQSYSTEYSVFIGNYKDAQPVIITDFNTHALAKYRLGNLIDFPKVAKMLFDIIELSEIKFESIPKDRPGLLASVISDISKRIHDGRNILYRLPESDIKTRCTSRLDGLETALRIVQRYHNALTSTVETLEVS